MFGKRLQLSPETMHMIEEIGRHMPGGFFIYRAQQPETLLYANQAVFEIYGCDDLEDFKRLTGYIHGHTGHEAVCALGAVAADRGGRYHGVDPGAAYAAGGVVNPGKARTIRGFRGFRAAAACARRADGQWIGRRGRRRNRG